MRKQVGHFRADEHGPSGGARFWARPRRHGQGLRPRESRQRRPEMEAASARPRAPLIHHWRARRLRADPSRKRARALAAADDIGRRAAWRSGKVGWLISIPVAAPRDLRPSFCSKLVRRARGQRVARSLARSLAHSLAAQELAEAKLIDHWCGWRRCCQWRRARPPSGRAPEPRSAIFSCLFTNQLGMTFGLFPCVFLSGR